MLRLDVVRRQRRHSSRTRGSSSSASSDRPEADAAVPLADSSAVGRLGDRRRTRRRSRAARRDRTVRARVRHDGREYAEVAVPLAHDGQGDAALGLARRPARDRRARQAAAPVRDGRRPPDRAHPRASPSPRVHARRLRRLQQAADRIAEGAFDEPVVDDEPDEVGQLAGSFDRMRIQLAQLDRARKEFVANASHELRTPLFSLAGVPRAARGRGARRGDAARVPRDDAGAGRSPDEARDRSARPLADGRGPDPDRAGGGEPRGGRRGSWPRSSARLPRHRAMSLEVDVDDEAWALADEERVLQIARALAGNALVAHAARARPCGSASSGAARGSRSRSRTTGPGSRRSTSTASSSASTASTAARRRGAASVSRSRASSRAGWAARSRSRAGPARRCSRSSSRPRRRSRARRRPSLAVSTWNGRRAVSTWKRAPARGRRAAPGYSGRVRPRVFAIAVVAAVLGAGAALALGARDRAHGRRHDARSSSSGRSPSDAAPRGACRRSATASTPPRSTPAARPASSRSTPISGPSGQAQGSGFVVDGKGTILTNAHVVTNVADAGGGTVQRRREALRRVQGSRSRPGRDRRLGPVQRRRRRPGRSGRPCPRAGAARRTPRPSSSARPVAAIGSPFNEQSSLSVGVVSATDRTIDSLTSGYSVSDAIQTDAPINQRQLRRAAVRRQGPRDRDQRPDPLDERHRRGRRLRDPDRHGAARARAARPHAAGSRTRTSASRRRT